MKSCASKNYQKKNIRWTFEGILNKNPRLQPPPTPWENPATKTPRRIWATETPLVVVPADQLHKVVLVLEKSG